MALRKIISFDGVVSVMTEHGPIPDGRKSVSLNAYVKVESVSANKNLAQAMVSFTDSAKAITKSYSFTPNMDGENFIKQAYDHLKILPEFSGAENC
jgi:hypothetical protein